MKHNRHFEYEVQTYPVEFHGRTVRVTVPPSNTDRPEPDESAPVEVCNQFNEGCA